MIAINLIANAASAILGAVAALHLYWAAGGLWPARSPRELIDTVIGNPRRNRMPPAWLTALVGLMLAAAALLPLSVVPVFPDGALLIYFPAGPLLVSMGGTLFVALVFLARGIAGYLPFWRRLHPAQPFATLDVLLYSPLCLLLGAALIFLDYTFWAMLSI